MVKKIYPHLIKAIYEQLGNSPFYYSDVEMELKSKCGISNGCYMRYLVDYKLLDVVSRDTRRSNGLARQKYQITPYGRQVATGERSRLSR
jgi:hypothetical protein